jgi:hypothetical protein
MAIKHTNIFHCKVLHNLPKLAFFGLKIYNLATLHRPGSPSHTYTHTFFFRKVTQFFTIEEVCYYIDLLFSLFFVVFSLLKIRKSVGEHQNLSKRRTREREGGGERGREGRRESERE